jgi:hypothetical protein
MSWHPGKKKAAQFYEKGHYGFIQDRLDGSLKVAEKQFVY